MKRFALLSVTDKTGIVEFARELVRLGWTILSTGGTALTLRAAGIPVIGVADYTGFPEIMDGRVKTMHPRVMGGVLGRPGTDDQVMTEHGIERIDLVVVNLYQFGAVVARPDCTLEMAIENIDVGGPTMIRAAAKNHATVTVLVDPGDYAHCLAYLDDPVAPKTTAKFRMDMAVKAFAVTASYDQAIHAYLEQRQVRQVGGGDRV